MKTKIIIFFLFIYTFSACASVKNANEKRNISAFDKIVAGHGFDIYYTQSSTYALEIETDEKNTDNIEAYVEKGTLKLGMKKNAKLKNKHTVKIYLRAPYIKEMTLSGGVDFKAKEMKSTQALSIALSGGSDIEIDKADVLECNIAISGGADCEMKSLKTPKLSISASGGSDADIVVDTKNASLAASGGSDIVLSGKTKNISMVASGASEINIKKLKYEEISQHVSGASKIMK